MSKFIKNRGRRLSKSKPNVSITSQLIRIKSTFPDSNIVTSTGTSFEIIVRLQPTSLSEWYDVKICYHQKNGLDINVINKELKVASNRTKLPHVYSHDEQRLCLFSYGSNEWSRSMSISSTIIPWISEWLYYYELWLIDGEWLGGGHDEYSSENINKKYDEKI